MVFIINHGHFGNHRLYTVYLRDSQINVTVTATASVVKNWLDTTYKIHRKKLRNNQLVVGLGVQWSIHDTQHPPADTLQLCVGHRCLIFQLSHADIVPENLQHFLQHRRNTFVGFWNYKDRMMLQRSVHELKMWKNPLDLRHFTVDVCYEDLSQSSIDEIVKKCLGYVVEQKKTISMSNWSAKYLSNEQVRYACVDAYFAFLLGKKIEAWAYW